MADHPGLFIVLEGADGSGKSTQFELLLEKLRRSGYQTEVFKFPQYDKSSSYFVKRYLNGEYGPASQINPYNATLFYALDRFEAGPAIKTALAEGKVVLSDRYVGSNMAHQGAKFADLIDKRSFFVWEDSLEYQVLGIPKPDINLFLRVPAEISYKLIGQKAARSYTNKSHDEHEKDINHLRKAVETYDALCQLFPADFRAIECAPDGQLLPVHAISKIIWQSLKPLLPEPKISSRPQQKPAKVKPAKNPGNPGELEWQIDKISWLSALQLKTHFGLLEIQPPRMSAKSGGAVYIPNFVNKKLRRDFESALKQICQQHKSLTSKLSKAESRQESRRLSALATPLASLTSAKMKLSPASAGLVIEYLTLASNTELITLGLELKKQVRGRWPQGEQEPGPTLRNSSPSAISDIIAKLTSDTMSQNQSAVEPIRLIEATPRNEFDLIAESLYPHSDLSTAQLTAQLENWDYSQKLKALSSALSGSAPAVLAQASYRFDLLTDHLVLLDLLDLRAVTSVQLQAGSPRHGYEVPESLEASDALDVFQDMFDRSLELYSQVQSAGDGQLAEYACLAGHRLRWQGTFSGLDLLKLASHPDGNLSQLAQQLVEAIRPTHPLSAERLSSGAQAPKAKNPSPKSGAKSRSRSRRHAGRPKKS